MLFQFLQKRWFIVSCILSMCIVHLHCTPQPPTSDERATISEKGGRELPSDSTVTEPDTREVSTVDASDGPDEAHSVRDRGSSEHSFEPPTERKASFESLPEDVQPEPRKLCSNQQKDPGEVNVDCGGACPACVQKITQYGITWTFAKGVRSGQFANGDHWVLGPVELTQISPLPKDGFHGFEINPMHSKKQPYDKRQTPYYDASLQPKIPSSSAPLRIEEGSLVSTVSNLPVKSTCKGRAKYWPAQIGGCTRSYLKSAAILTVLKRIPPKDAFRPAYMGKDKSIKYRTSALKMGALSRLQPVQGTPSLKQVERSFERPWLDHVRGWSGAYLHPGDNMYNYGREIAHIVGTAALLLNLDFSKLPDQPSKQTLLIRFVQLGIDLAGMVDNGHAWPHDGGHGIGRKLPILFAGVLLDDPHMKNVAKWKTSSVCVAGKPGEKGSPFQEDSTTFYVSDAAVQISASTKWDPDKRATPRKYTSKDKGIPEWGIRHSCSPHRDNFHWSATYRAINGAGNVGSILTAHIMGIRTLWGHRPVFDFEDRWAENTGAKIGVNAWLPFAYNMWKQYRDRSGCRWTRDDSTDPHSQGHYVCGAQTVKCAWQSSSCAKCKLVKRCSEYPDKRSRTYDPCGLSCSP